MASVALAHRSRRLLALIGASISFAKSISTSGVDDFVAKRIEESNISNSSALWVTYFVTMVLTEIISNNSAAALCVPIVVRIAARLNVR